MVKTASGNQTNGMKAPANLVLPKGDPQLSRYHYGFVLLILHTLLNTIMIRLWHDIPQAQWAQTRRIRFP